MINDKKTGLVYDFEQPDLLRTRIEYAIEHQDEMVSRKRNCLKKAVAYSEDYVMKQIAKEMGMG